MNQNLTPSASRAKREPRLSLACPADVQTPNATMSLHGVSAVSVLVHPTLPADIDPADEAALGAYLKHALAPLSDLGWRVEIEVGPNDPDQPD